MRTLVASLSDQAIIITARSRQVTLTLSPSSCSTPPPLTRGSGGRVTWARSILPSPACRYSS